MTGGLGLPLRKRIEIISTVVYCVVLSIWRICRNAAMRYMMGLEKRNKMQLKKIVMGIVIIIDIILLAGILFGIWMFIKANRQQGSEEQQDSEWEMVVVYLDGANISEQVVDTYESTKQWVCEDRIYFLEYEEEDRQENLYYQEDEKNEKVLIQKGIVNFVINSDETKIYGVEMCAKPSVLGFVKEYRIVEISLEQGTSQVLQDLNKNYFRIEGISEDSLYYTELSFEKRKSKVFCLNLQTGKKQCIYRTDKEVVGIVVGVQEGNNGS